MTKAAEEGRLDPVVGRDNEIERLAQVLSRRKKNNPVLIGEPGVGKSAIVEGLACESYSARCRESCLTSDSFRSIWPRLWPGTKYRGQFEERIKAILNELSKNPISSCLSTRFIPSSEPVDATGSLDAANMLKPALSRGEIQCIGANDSRRVSQEYRERRCLGAPVPKDYGRADNARGDLADSQKYQGALRRSPQRDLHRRCVGGLCQIDRPLHQRPQFPRQGNRCARRGRGPCTCIEHHRPKEIESLEAQIET